jgi:hypothetical protein
VDDNKDGLGSHCSERRGEELKLELGVEWNWVRREMGRSGVVAFKLLWRSVSGAVVERPLDVAA